MPTIDRSDIYSQNIEGVYITLVTVTCGSTSFYLNDGNASFIFKGHQYTPAAFELSEPSQSDEEGNGSFSIIGVPQEYIELVQEADPNTEITLTAGVGKLLYSGGVFSIDGGDYLMDSIEYEVDTVSVNSASATLVFNMHTGGIFSYYISSKSFSTSAFPGLYG